MTFDLWPTTQDLFELLSTQVAELGGSVVNSYDDGERLLARAVLAPRREVARGDRLQGGVALRADAREIRIHPYVFRQVCSNGAIFAQAVGTRVVLRDECGFDPAAQVRDAVRECCEDEAFATAAGQMRAAKDVEADGMLAIMPFLSKFPREQVRRILESIIAQLGSGRDRTRYGLMNAVTATARETRDLESRWRLEELGGAIAAGLPRNISPRDDRAAAQAAPAAGEPEVTANV